MVLRFISARRCMQLVKNIPSFKMIEVRILSKRCCFHALHLSTTMNLLILIDVALFAMEHYASIINLDYLYIFKMFQNRTQQGSII